MPHDHSHGNPPKPNNNNKKALLSLILKPVVMTLLTSLFFLFLGLAGLLLIVLHRRHRRHRRRHRLRRLSHFRFSSSGAGSEAGECVVCLEAFRDGQWCRALAGCGHVFHRRCVDTWLVKVPACPMCRTRVRLDFGDGVCGGSVRGLDDEAKWLWGSRVS